MIPNFVNLVLCFGLGWSAMCRLAKMHECVMERTACLYVFLFVASVLSGLQFFLFGQLAGWYDVLASGVVCVMLLLSMPDWRYGPPVHCVRA